MTRRSPAGIRLPLRLHDTDVGVVVDAGDRDVFTVDVNRERRDEDVREIAAWIVAVVNSAAIADAEKHNG